MPIRPKAKSRAKPDPELRARIKESVKGLSPDELREVVNNEWLGLGDTTKIKVKNPFEDKTAEDIADPMRHLLKVMREPQYFFFTGKHMFGKIIPPQQLALLRELWVRPFPMLIGSRGLGKSFLLALYAMMRATLCQGIKVVVVGAAFRQAKVVFEYCEEIWYNAPVLRDICSNSAKNGPRRDVDRCTLRIGDSLIIALPLGDGTKIRGQRANIIIADEFASIPNEVFENVVSGFAAVAMDPIEKLRETARKKALVRLGLEEEEDAHATGPGMQSNQTILSGTAYYGFNHFCDYWKKWKAIIESRGDRRKLENIFNGEVPAKFNWRDYSVMRVPVELLPDGFMDSKHVAKAKATIHLSQYLMEYGACFALDSNGFYKRSLVEKCVVGKPGSPICHESCGEVSFNAVLRGDNDRQHVIGIDPASERDNFSIVVLELWPDHRRIVHCWTITKKRHKAKFQKGLAKEEDFYGYVARKIRDLMRLFPTARVAIDSQGGAVGVMEALCDGTRLKEGEVRILPAIDPEKPADTDNQPGLHIVELVNFAKADWVSEANHGMRKDFEDRVLLFPEFDPAVVGLAIEEDKITGRVKATPDGDEKLYDTLEDCVMDIEELKEELATIQHSQTGTSLRDKWDTPEVKIAGGRKGRLRKDRYSALLMANMVARVFQRVAPRASYPYSGGFAHEIVRDKERQQAAGLLKPDWQNPDWYTAGVNRPGYGAVVRR